MNGAIDYRDLILLLIHKAPGEKVPGRTILQKVLFFSLARLHKEDDFSANYFGPHSSAVSDALSSLVSLGFVREGQELVFPGLVRYEYELTDEGKELVLHVFVDGELASAVTETLRAIEENGFWAKSDEVSLAAKAYFARRLKGSLFELDELSSSAKTLGWNVASETIERMGDLLTDLQLVQV